MILRVRLASVLVISAGLLVAGERARAQGADAVPPPPAGVTAFKAYGMLERACAGCHQKGRLEQAVAAGGLDDVLALDAIARRPWLIRGGLPDASLIYNVALTGERHHEAFNDPAMVLPAPDEVQALRDWIAELPAEPRGGCATDALDGPSAVTAIDEALERLEPETRRLTRFVSLVHLARDCATAASLEAGRAAIRRITGGRSHAIDPRGLVWRFGLPDIGLSIDQWRAWTAAYPLRDTTGLRPSALALAAMGTEVPLVAADWLAGRLAETRPGAGEDIAALGRSWHQPARLARFAAETWQPEEAVSGRLGGAPPSLLVAARRLTSGEAVDRPRLDLLAAWLAGRQVPAGAAEPDLEIALWADKARYRAGDTAVLSVVASRDCHITLIGVDRGGRATVLYPNEIEPVNRLKARQVLRVPGDGAAYRFRFKEKGRETVVAICSLNRPAPVGLTHDFERLRFSVVGDWQLFLREPPQMTEARRDDAAGDVPRPQAPARRRGRTGEAEAAAAIQPDVQTRTAVAITIED